MHHLPKKCREVGNSCPLRQWLLYPLMFKPSKEKPVKAQQIAITGRLCILHSLWQHGYWASHYVLALSYSTQWKKQQNVLALHTFKHRSQELHQCNQWTGKSYSSQDRWESEQESKVKSTANGSVIRFFRYLVIMQTIGFFYQMGVLDEKSQDHQSDNN